MNSLRSQAGETLMFRNHQVSDAMIKKTDIRDFRIILFYLLPLLIVGFHEFIHDRLGIPYLVAYVYINSKIFNGVFLDIRNVNLCKSLCCRFPVIKNKRSPANLSILKADSMCLGRFGFNIILWIIQKF